MRAVCPKPPTENTMKFVRTVVVFDRGNLIESGEWKTMHDAMTSALTKVVHPPESWTHAGKRPASGCAMEWCRFGSSSSVI